MLFTRSPPTRRRLWAADVPGHHALRVARHRTGVCGLLLPAGAAGGPRTDLVSAAARHAGSEPQPLEEQPPRRVRYALGPGTRLARADGGDERRGTHAPQSAHGVTRAKTIRTIRPLTRESEHVCCPGQEQHNSIS